MQSGKSAKLIGMQKIILTVLNLIKVTATC